MIDPNLQSVVRQCQTSAYKLVHAASGIISNCIQGVQYKFAAYQLLHNVTGDMYALVVACDSTIRTYPLYRTVYQSAGANYFYIVERSSVPKSNALSKKFQMSKLVTVPLSLE